MSVKGAPAGKIDIKCIFVYVQEWLAIERSTIYKHKLAQKNI